MFSSPQVAEMHGELMEFNERLHKLLRLRESQVSVCASNVGVVIIIIMNNNDNLYYIYTIKALE